MLLKSKDIKAEILCEDHVSVYLLCCVWTLMLSVSLENRCLESCEQCTSTHPVAFPFIVLTAIINYTYTSMSFTTYGCCHPCIQNHNFRLQHTYYF